MPRWVKRRIALTLAALLMFSTVPVVVAQSAQAARTSSGGCPAPVVYPDGDGSAGDPFQISEPKHLQYLWETSADWDDSFVLTASLDLAGCTWSAGIGDSTTNFTGSFDGQGNSIDALSIVEISSGPMLVATGLFGVLGPAGIVKDLKLFGVRVEADGNQQQVVAGSVAGLSQGTIRNVEVRSKVGVPGSVVSDGSRSLDPTAVTQAGGVVGLTSPSAVVSDAISDVTVTALGSNNNGGTIAGGVIGANGATTTGLRMQASGTVSAQDGSVYAGGAVGFTSGSLSEVSSDANVLVSGTAGPGRLAVAGGVVGWAQSPGAIDRAYGIGYVRATGGTVFAGGVVGYNEFDISEAWSEMSVQATSSVANSLAFAGGISGAQASGDVVNSYSRSNVSAEALETGALGYAGGISGFADTVAISNAGARGIINAWANAEAGAGGLLGRSSATINKSYAASIVDAQQGGPGGALSPGSTGGFVGLNQAPGDGVDSFWNSDLVADGLGTGSAPMTGLQGLTTLQATSITPYDDSGWSISDGYNAGKIWNWCPRINAGYPLNSFRFGPNECGTISPASQSARGVTTQPIAPTTAYTPAYLNAGPVTYSISPSLPAGLDFDTTTGVVSGTPSVVSPLTAYTVTATDGTSNAEATINLAVVAASLSPPSQTLTGQKGTAVSPTQTLTANDFAVTPTYTVAPALPSGLTLNTGTGVISGTPTVAWPATAHTISGVSGMQSATATVTITVTDNTPPTPVRPRPPSAPGTPSGIPGDGSITVTWTAPVLSGSSPVRSYQATATPGGASCTAIAPAVSCTITGLTNGQPYIVTVKAISDSGTSPESSPSAPITPTGSPSPSPTPIEVAVTGKREGEFATARGMTSAEMSGKAATPWFRFPGTRGYTAGQPRLVEGDGSFEWRRKTSKKVYVYFTIEEAKSPRIIIPRR